MENKFIGSENPENIEAFDSRENPVTAIPAAAENAENRENPKNIEAFDSRENPEITETVQPETNKPDFHEVSEVAAIPVTAIPVTAMPATATPVIPVTAIPATAKTPETRTKIPKRNRFAQVVAAALAVVILGGASGFGGAYLASRDNGPVVNYSNTPRLPEYSAAQEIATPENGIVSEMLSASSGKLMTAEQLYETVKDSVVLVNVYFNQPFRGGSSGASDTPAASGSGVVFTEDGYVLTCAHVISGSPSKISVVINDNEEEEYTATVVGEDSATDLAVLKISTKTKLKAASIGSTKTLKVGQDVSVIGYPMTSTKSMTKGIISGLGRDVSSAGQGGYALSSIQIDAAINMGNSGGPLFDMYGNVIGIVNLKFVYDNLVENMGFAINADEAKAIVNDLLANGTVTGRPAIGITTYQLTEFTADTMGNGISEGLLVSGIDDGAPVAKSGLAVGDIIIKAEGKPVSSVADVQTATKNMKPGDILTVTVVRFDQFGKKVEKDIKIELTKAK
ncbi:serine protease Do-like HtrB [Clostridia bacterium]|nr:serine protease Do-like HtrB [Clostridia bacterium]